MNLKELIIKHHKGREENAFKDFAAELNTGIGNISHWACGRRSPSDVWRVKMAKILKIDVPALDKIIEETAKQYSRSAHSASEPQAGYSTLPTVPTTEIPVIGFMSTEYFTTCSFEENYNATEVLIVMTTPGVKLKAIKVVGDAMEPECRDGGHLLVAVGAICEDGILSIVKIDGQYTAKNLYIRGDKAILDSENPKYKRREVPLKDLHIVGPVPYTCEKKAPKPFKK
jgi:SOS-response transcriptional repressor LexA